MDRLLRYELKTSALLFVLSLVFPLCAASADYVTEYGLGPDKWATAWLLTKYGGATDRLIVVSPGTTPTAGTPFDVHDAKYRRIGDRAAFEVALDGIGLKDLTLVELSGIVHEIEINAWRNEGTPESRVVEDAFRALQVSNGRSQ